MKQRNPLTLLIIASLILIPAVYILNNQQQQPPPNPLVTGNTTIKIAAFNIQIFGKTKRAKPDVMNVLTQIARQFDIMLVQEIRDSSETTAPYYLNLINQQPGPTYAYIRSPRVGRTSSKEAYAYYYNTETIQHINGTDHIYNDTYDVFEREPYIATFTSGTFDFTLVGIHTKPDDAENEIGNLTAVVSSILQLNPNETDIIVMGDFNADGSYYDEEACTPFRDDETWIITNDMNTMTKTDWTYDRIVHTNQTSTHEYKNNTATVYYFDQEYNITDTTLIKAVSDHYPVYAEYYNDLPDDD
jgi:endonuclease/exonuclease/phosphatase family metal-dependent hydrolase